MMSPSIEDEAMDVADAPRATARTPALPILALAALSGIIVCAYHASLGRSSAMVQVAESREERKRRLQAERDERMMEVVKAAWPECVNQKMNGIQCKTFIDEEILTLFTGDDRMTRTVLVGKRSILDFFYNSIVIYMDDDDLVQGRDGDGMIYYDFQWAGSGVEATDEQTAEIPPVIAVETDGYLDVSQPILVEGCSLEEALAGTCTRPINGGVVIDPNAQNCPGSDERLQAALDDARTAAVEPAGDRDLPAFDCSCLTGYACCLLIKTMVRDVDVNGMAIQCHLNFVEGSAKADAFNDGHGKTVKIYTNHNFVVSITPEVEGSWPLSFN